MNKFLQLCSIIVLITSISTIEAQAQRNQRERDSEYFSRNEIYIQYGTPTIIELVTTLDNPNPGAGHHHAKTQNHVFSGVGGVGYNFFINPNVSLGFYAGISYSSADLLYQFTSGGDYIPTVTSSINSYVGQLSASWVYFRDGMMELSSGAYLGVGYLNETITTIGDNNREIDIPNADDRYEFAYHITAVKLRYGEVFGGFVELGFGYRGLVNVGLSIKI